MVATECTIAAAAGDTDVVAKALKGRQAAGKTFKVHFNSHNAQAKWRQHFAAMLRSPPLQSLGRASRPNRVSALLAPKSESIPIASLIDKPLGILPIQTQRNLL
jgi:hypothetical protein